MFIVLAADVILSLPQVQHTYDIVNKKGEVTTTVVFGEVSTMHLHALVYLPLATPTTQPCRCLITIANVSVETP